MLATWTVHAQQLQSRGWCAHCTLTLVTGLPARLKAPSGFVIPLFPYYRIQRDRDWRRDLQQGTFMSKPVRAAEWLLIKPLH